MGKATQEEEWGPKSQSKSQRQPLLQLLRVPQEDQAIQLPYTRRVPRLVPHRLPGPSLSLCEPLWSQLLILCVTHLAIKILPPSLLQDSLSLI